MAKKVFKLEFFGKELIVEHGQLAKQANGSVLVRYSDTVILCAAVMNKKAVEGDFFPLTVRYEEKLYSVGKIPGGFIKREGRPSENATLVSRLIDRPIRPMFDEGFRNEVQVIDTVLSVDQDSTPEMTALFGSSLALGVSNIPFDGPVAGVIVGYVDSKFVINPTTEEMSRSEIDLKVAGTKHAINMVEASSKQVSEEVMLEALMTGHEAIKTLIKFQEEIISEIGEEKVEVKIMMIDEEIRNEVTSLSSDKLLEALQIHEKLEKYARIDEVKEETVTYMTEKYADSETLKDIINQTKKVLDEVEMDHVRSVVTEKNIRVDGRGLKEIRMLDSEIDLLPRTHGSALFTRGETQSLSITTLGALNEHQILDGLTDEEEKRFMLHYNFPQFSVGETGRYGGPGRREIGHGALGERALLQVMPSEEEFPYTVRVVSETLESNGSSSQASICAGCMSLMAAGVPIKAPVAGIAMGLITKGDKYKVLTDIQGIEDHLGDMDFKVSGTKNGICALQMDIKIKGITRDILKEALYQAKEARMEILEHMEKTIATPRTELSKYAPKIKMITINPDKIKDVIGRGGEMITKIIQETSNVISVSDKNAVKIDIEDDGRVMVYHTDYAIIERAINRILEITKEVEIGKIYSVKVVKVEDFGAFVELWPGCEGLVHVSQLDTKRVEKPSDIVKVGDEIIVKATGYDKRGKLNLSRKDALSKEETEILM